MSIQLIVPLALAAVVGVATTASHRRLAPRCAAPLLALTVVAVTLAVVPAMVVIAVGYVVQLPWLAGSLAWCRNALGVHEPIPPWMGVPAVVLLAVAAVRTRRVLRSWRFFHRATSQVTEIVPSDAVFAYTLPGAGGQIVVSSGLVHSLTPVELAVVLAHERAHAVFRHDRYVLTADLADALVPLVRPLCRRLLFALERCADDAAVAHLDGDRETVARTLARVALSHRAVPTPAMGVAGLGVVGRVQHLLTPPSPGPTRLWVVVMVAGSVGAVAAAAVQLHHVLPLLVALCPG